MKSFAPPHPLSRPLIGTVYSTHDGNAVRVVRSCCAADDGVPEGDAGQDVRCGRVPALVGGSAAQDVQAQGEGGVCLGGRWHPLPTERDVSLRRHALRTAAFPWNQASLLRKKVKSAT